MAEWDDPVAMMEAGVAEMKARSVRHGPLIHRAPKTALGWLEVECDCGWKSRPFPSLLHVVEEYGNHRAEVGM
jgi:hypothetical protein